MKFACIIVIFTQTKICVYTFFQLQITVEINISLMLQLCVQRFMFTIYLVTWDNCSLVKIAVEWLL